MKQIVGSTLTDEPGAVVTNFVSEHDAAWFARRFADDDLSGGHVIQLGPGNQDAARRALRAFPGGLHIGGGITAANAATWLEAGASHVIVTSWLFVDGRFSPERLAAMVAEVGAERLVIDLSCAPDGDGGYVVMVDRWQRRTNFSVDAAALTELSTTCAEFLIHGVAVEGKQGGMDRTLINRLAEWSPITVTYAGGATSLDDLRFVATVGGGRVALTIGSALDLFGGTGVAYSDAVSLSNWFDRSDGSPPTL